MNGHAKTGVEHNDEMERYYLEREIHRLNKENHNLKEFCIYQEKKLKAFQNQTGWDKFNDCLETLGEPRYQDAIDVLVNLQKQHCERPASTSPYGPLRITAKQSSFELNKQPRATNKVQLNEVQESPQPSAKIVTSTSQTEVKKVRPSLRRVESAIGLATRFASLFKKSKKPKDLDKKHDVIDEYVEREKVEAEYDARLCNEQKTRPDIIKSSNKGVTGTHNKPEEWRLQQAQNEYKKSQESEKASGPVRIDSVKTVKGRQGAGKESREVEAELVVALEKDLLASFPRNMGTVRTLNWPKGSRHHDEDAFNGRPLPVPRANSIQPLSTKRHSTHERPQSLIPEPIHFENLPPASPPPAAPLPAIPHKMRPTQSQQRRARQSLPPPQSQAEEEVVQVQGSATPQSQITPAAENPRVQRLRKRCSAPPSPSPRFVTYRAVSPSPGGNETMTANPTPSWLKTRRTARDFSGD
jgi:hypothetical protein